jgi:hypothetical protein
MYNFIFFENLILMEVCQVKPESIMEEFIIFLNMKRGLNQSYYHQ